MPGARPAKLAFPLQGVGPNSIKLNNVLSMHFAAQNFSFLGNLHTAAYGLQPIGPAAQLSRDILRQTSHNQMYSAWTFLIRPSWPISSAAPSRATTSPSARS